MREELNIKHLQGQTRVLIGQELLGGLGAILAKGPGCPKAAIVSDTNVEKHYLGVVSDSLKQSGIASEASIFPAGEESKSFASLKMLLEGLLEFGLNREDCVIALGGGVIGDLAGLAASLIKRGVGLVQVPTTLLAQVDSSIGGKTGINTAFGKNLIGSFHPAACVLADVATLKTLPEAEFRAGYAEVVKHAILEGEDSLTALERDFGEFFKKNPKILTKTIAASIRIKGGIVEEDEREAGIRRLLNLGHSFAHGLEVLGDFNKLRHGEAVALGLVLAFRFAEFKGREADQTRPRVEKLLEKAGLATNLKEVPFTIDRKALIKAMTFDKKNTAQGLTLIVPGGAGKVAAEAVDKATLDAFLKTVDI